MHFVCAALIARVMSGNLLATLLGTFLAIAHLYSDRCCFFETGHLLLGTEFVHEPGMRDPGFIEKFVWAADDLRKTSWPLSWDVK